MSETAYIIGTGPSLKNIDMSLLKNKATMTFNRAFVAFNSWGFDPVYYVAIDGNDIRGMYKDLNKIIQTSNVQKFFLIKIEDNQKHTNQDFQDGDIVSNEMIYVDNPKITLIEDIKNGYEYDLNDITIKDNGKIIQTNIPSNVGFMGLKILYNLGYRKIALLGMDARYVDDKNVRKVKIMGGSYQSFNDDDPNHFCGNYNGKNMIFMKLEIN